MFNNTDTLHRSRSPFTREEIRDVVIVAASSLASGLFTAAGMFAAAASSGILD